jgi:hypothetical protein
LDRFYRRVNLGEQSDVNRTVPGDKLRRAGCRHEHCRKRGFFDLDGHHIDSRIRGAQFPYERYGQLSYPKLPARELGYAS